MWAGCGFILLERAPALIEAARAGSQGTSVRRPEYVSILLAVSARSSSCVVAEVAAAETLAGSAVAVLYLVQHIESKPLVDGRAVAALLGQLTVNVPRDEKLALFSPRASLQQ